MTLWRSRLRDLAISASQTCFRREDGYPSARRSVSWQIWIWLHLTWRCILFGSGATSAGVDVVAAIFGSERKARGMAGRLSLADRSGDVLSRTRHCKVDHGIMLQQMRSAESAAGSRNCNDARNGKDSLGMENAPEPDLDHALDLAHASRVGSRRDGRFPRALRRSCGGVRAGSVGIAVMEGALAAVRLTVDAPVEE